MNIGFIIGSLREQSYNTKIASHITQAFSDVTFEQISIGELPFFNEDLETNGDPQAVQQFKAAVARMDGLIILTPEYNGSIPGVLKNALDWGSRPVTNSVFHNKQIGIIGATPGGMGTAFAQIHLRQVLEAMRADVLPHEKLHVSRVHELCAVAEEPNTFRYVDRYVQQFIQFIQNTKGVHA